MPSNISRVAPFKTRLMIANGIFSSKLIFQISLWGGAEDYLLQALQIIQNKAARFVAQRNRYTAVSELFRHCGGLSVRQLAFYHNVMLIYKTITTKYPKYIYSKLQTQFPYNTRLAQTESVRMGPEFRSKLELTERSFMVRATSDYNLLPTELRKVPTLENFKKKLKLWVMENIKK